MCAITVLRGFKVPLPVLDAFFIANGITEEHERLCAGIPPSYNTDSDKVTTLLRKKVGEGAARTRVFVPYKMRFNYASSAYIAYDWLMVFAQRELKSDELPESPPQGFAELRKEILSHHEGPVDDGRFHIGLYIVVTDEQSYVPPEVCQREVNIKCDQCEATFEDGHWTQRQRHRQEVHGSQEGQRELPENA